MVILRDLIGDLSIVFESLVAVREAFRNIKHQAIAYRQLNPDPLMKAGGICAQVNNHVQD